MTRPIAEIPLGLPSNLAKLLEEAVFHLWDENYPEPDLSILAEWLEAEGWDEVVSGMFSSCIYSSSILDAINDENLLECTDVLSKKKIRNSDRISFARNHIEHLLSESMDSIHSITIGFEHMPPAELCFTIYYHGQGGATFSDFQLCHSTEEFIEQFEGEIVTTPDKLSDLHILNLWKQSEVQLKSWRKSLS